VFGFDFGTTWSKAASIDASGKPVIILNQRGDPTTPSCVYLGSSGDMHVGKDAREQGCVDPSGFAENFKLDLDQTDNLLTNGQTLTPVDAAAAIIGALKKDAERGRNVQVDRCVATCPANFRDDRKQALIEAFERNGIEVLRLVPEPTAAGIAYSDSSPARRSTLLIYDFGGGTFDASLLDVDGPQITVVATEGVPKLGGNDLNGCLRERVLERIRTELGVDPTSDKDALFRLELAQRIEQAKISLGTRKEVPIVLSYNGTQLIETVKQQEFHAAMGPLVKKSLDAIDRLLAAAGVRPADVTRLIMVGGTSRLPYIQNAVADHTGLVPKTDIDPEKAVAYGAALACVAELQKRGEEAYVDGKLIPSPDVFVREITAHAVGCCVADRAGGPTHYRHAVIIPKNTPIPCKRTDSFYLENEDQSSAQVEILQGEPDADRDSCLLIGELLLNNLPKEAVRSRRIVVDYQIDNNGMVTATATDKVGGARQSVSVDYKKGIKPKPKPKSI